MDNVKQHGLESPDSDNSATIVHTNRQAIAVISVPAQGDIFEQAEDQIDSANERFSLDPARTIYVIRNTSGNTMFRLCPEFAEGRCVDYSIRQLDKELLQSVSQQFHSGAA